MRMWRGRAARGGDPLPPARPETRGEGEGGAPARTAYCDEEPSLWVSVPPATVTHRPARRRWIANWVPSIAGRTVPEKSTRRWARTRRELTFVRIRTATGTVTMLLVPLGESPVMTRN